MDDKHQDRYERHNPESKFEVLSHLHKSDNTPQTEKSDKLEQACQLLVSLNLVCVCVSAFIR